MKLDDTEILSNLSNHQRGVTGLTLHEVGEYIRRLGIKKKYIPVPEYPLSIEDGKKRKVDWVWICKSRNQVVAAFEIEGSDVRISESAQSIKLDFDKFDHLFRNHKLENAYIVTYSVRFIDNQFKRLSPNGIERVQNFLKDKNSKISVLSF